MAIIDYPRTCRGFRLSAKEVYIMNYSEKLKDPRWQKKRLEIFARDEWCCRNCYDSKSTLTVHHFRYIPGRDPWDYPPDLLISLCEECHSIEYQMIPQEIESLIEQIKDKGFFHHQLKEITKWLYQ